MEERAEEMKTPIERMLNSKMVELWGKVDRMEREREEWIERVKERGSKEKETIRKVMELAD